MELSKNQRRKLQRYNQEPSFSSAELLFQNEVKQIKKNLYRKPGHKALSQAMRESLVQAKPKTIIQL